MRGIMYYNLLSELSPMHATIAYALVLTIVAIFSFITSGMAKQVLQSIYHIVQLGISIRRIDKSIKSLEDSHKKLKDSISKIEELRSKVSGHRSITLSNMQDKLAIVESDLESRLSNMRDMKRIFNQ